MGKEDTEHFLASLQARAAEELVATARLWEDRLLVHYYTPFFLVRVADIRAALNSRATALSLYKEVCIPVLALVHDLHIYDRYRR